MRLITCKYLDTLHVGVMQGTHIYLPALAMPWPHSMLDIIDGGTVLMSELARRVESAPDSCRVPEAKIHLLAPIPRPRKNVICLGLNYADHAQESYAAQGKKVEIPQHPVVFTKAVTSVTGPFDDIPLDPHITTQLDWEVELAVVIGRGGRHIEEHNALDYVFGYTVINDVSARDIQFRHKQYFLGKSLDGACPMGPCIVTADEIPNPQSLSLRTWVNGVLKQSSTTQAQIFSVAQIISLLSRSLTLEPGDIIATGTPSGVGFARTPPEFLSSGDSVECEIEAIGRLRNRIALVQYPPT